MCSVQIHMLKSNKMIAGELGLLKEGDDVEPSGMGLSKPPKIPIPYTM